MKWQLYKESDNKVILNLQLKANSNNLSKMRHFAQILPEILQVDTIIAFQITLVLDELITNAIDHGSAFRDDSLVCIDMYLTKDKMEFFISDEGGKPFDPEHFINISTNENLLEVGGKGLKITSQIVDEFSFFFDPFVKTVVYFAKVIMLENFDIDRIINELNTMLNKF